MAQPKASHHSSGKQRLTRALTPAKSPVDMPTTVLMHHMIGKLPALMPPDHEKAIEHPARPKA